MKVSNVVAGIFCALGLLWGSCTASFAGSPADCLLKHELAHAGGWGASHPNPVYTRHCGGLPMPPGAYVPRFKPVIHYVSQASIYLHCGYAQACTHMYNDRPSVIYLPKPGEGIGPPGKSPYYDRPAVKPVDRDMGAGAYS